MPMPPGYKAEYRRRQIAAGRCIECREPAAAGKIRCRRHLARAAAAGRRVYHELHPAARYNDHPPRLDPESNFADSPETA